LVLELFLIIFTKWCLGDLIILIAQVIQAVQVVIEEKFVNGKDIHPLQAVGWEGECYC